MLKRIKLLLERNAIYIAILISISIAILSLVKIDPVAVPDFSSSDKFFHSIAYFFLMLSWLYAFYKKDSFLKNVRYLILGCIIYGIILEVLQGTTTNYRTASYLDMLANSLGVVLAVLVFHIFEKKIRVI